MKIGDVIKPLLYSNSFIIGQKYEFSNDSKTWETYTLSDYNKCRGAFSFTAFDKDGVRFIFRQIRYIAEHVEPAEKRTKRKSIRKPGTNEPFYFGDTYQFSNNRDNWYLGTLYSYSPEEGRPYETYDDGVYVRFAHIRHIKRIKTEPKKTGGFIEKIDIDIYRQSLLFCYGSTKAEVIKWLESYDYGGEMPDDVLSLIDKIKSDDGLENANATTYIKPKSSITVLFMTGKNNDRLSTLVHELLHVCIGVGNRIGMECTGETSEAFCYLQQWLFNICYNKIQDYER